jgi:ABC-type uncharacterized transport system permease subunit
MTDVVDQAKEALLDTRRLASIGFILLIIIVVLLISPPELVRNLDNMILEIGFLTATIQSSVPIALAGIGGLYAEKSGVINIGLEGLLIVGAFVSVATAFALGEPRGPLDERTALWVGFFVAVLASTLLAFLFGVICIRWKADQIIAGLAIWLLALGAAPFGAVVIFGSKNGGGVGVFNRISIPVLAEIPVLGPVFFDAYPTTFIMFITVPLAWWVLNRTPYGNWVKASGEHPEALDTAGVNVNLVRYSTVLVSGVLSGIGGAALALTSAGRFVGAGQTMVEGRGFIAIVTYLMGNYNPFGTFLAGSLFAGMDALQIRAQQIQEVSAAVPADIVGIVPHVSVIIVLVFFGYTRIPAKAGEHYEPGED